MNFYSLNGSNVDTNNLFENKPIYENFENTQSQPQSQPQSQNQVQNQAQNQGSLLDRIIGDDEDEFASVPTTKSTATDSNFQCSDGYYVKGSSLGDKLQNSNLNDCKKMCENNKECIGFNFNNKNNVCTLKKNASSMDNNKNLTLCIKKSAGNTNCKVNNNNSVKAFNELDSIFNEQESVNLTSNNQNMENNNSGDMIPNTDYPMDVPSMENNQMDNLDSNLDSNTDNQAQTEAQIEAQIKLTTEEVETNNSNMGNNPPGVYVDLDCFMKNINVLQNRTDNMMIDLSLLLSNIKNCSYVKKTSSDSRPQINNEMNSQQLIEQITSKINIPEPNTVKLNNVPANVLVSNNNSNTPAQVLEIAREPFTTDTDSESESNSYNLYYKDLVLVVIIVIIVYLLIFRK